MLSCQIYPNIIPQHSGAVCCVICWLLTMSLSLCHTVTNSQEIYAPVNVVSTTPIILILQCCQAGSILISSPNTFAPFVVSFVDYYNDLSPLPCRTPSLLHNISTHFIVQPLLHLSARIRRCLIISYAYEAQWTLQNTHPADWWGISNIRPCTQ